MSIPFHKSELPWDTIWTHANIATCDHKLGLIENAGIAVKDNLIAWVGPMTELSNAPEICAKQVNKVQGCITPGLIDCHSHVVYAGNRSNEFEMRLKGMSYTEIAKQGGGIKSTVTATRLASEEDLFLQSLKRVQSLQSQGLTTIEIKSGYGLDLETELKMLRVAKRIEQTLPITVKKTFLGAHSVPLEYQGKIESYIDLLCHEMIPKVAELQYADAVDVFCENIAFDLKQTERIFQTAQKYNLAIKCHSEQLSYSQSAILAAQYGALSVDHLEYLTEEGVQTLSKFNTIAVLLPGAFYFLREKKSPPIDLLRQHKVPIAIATDCNPGTSPILSLLLILNMACTLFYLTPEEALLGVTLNAAKSLGMEKTHGALSVGKHADFAIWDIGHPNELAYYLGGNPLCHLIKNGKPISM